MDKVRSYIKEQHMLAKGDRIVLGVSGGADSVAMLQLLVSLRQEYSLSLFVVHVNHGIRPEAAEDAEYVEQLCEERGLPFFLFQADIPAMAQAQGKSEEEMGREFRYACLAKTARAQQAHKLAVAHHLGDQAETVLFHMMRGTDLTGMAGIRPVTPLMLEGQTFTLLRPLLCLTRGEIVDWLERQKLGWREDRTNQENAYTRNCIRNDILPRLEQLHPRATLHIAELADTMQDYADFIRCSVQDYEAQHIVRGAQGALQINRNELAQNPVALVRGVLYDMLVQVAGQKRDWTREHVAALYGLLEQQSGKRLQLPYGVEAVLSYENLIIRKCLEREETDAFYRLLFPDASASLETAGTAASDLVLLPEEAGQVECTLLQHSSLSSQEWEEMLQQAGNSKNYYTKYFDCVKIRGKLCIRTVASADYIVIYKTGERKTLSRYFKDCKIPVEQRPKTLVLAVGDEVLWLIGGRRCEQYRLQEDTQSILKVTYKRRKK